MLNRLSALVIALLVIFSAAGGPALAVTDEEIGKAIKQMQDYLYGEQDKATGSWDKLHGQGNDREITGPTALVVTALIYSGESYQRPELSKAIAYIRANEPKGTYTTGLRCHVWSHLPDSFKPLLDADVTRLVMAANRDTTIHYELKKEKSWDHSTMQYALLGMWEGAKRQVRPSEWSWQEVSDHWIKTQQDDGGWGYNDKKEESRGSMVAAGLTALSVAQQEVYRRTPTANAAITKSIDRGLEWLNKNFVADKSPGGGQHIYYLYGMERVALALGYKYYNNKDWYESGASVILRKLKGGKVGDGPDTAFALMFLSRGRVPVWITKLQIDGTNWNNHPNDIYFLNQFLSDYREGELNWQVLGLDRPVAELRSTPILFLSSEQRVELSDEHKAKLKAYLDAGGLLLANPDGASQAFTSSMIKLGEEMYPNLKWRTLSEDHPLFKGHDSMGPGNAGQVRTLSNGARDLIVMPLRDFGYSWQSETRQEGVPWDFAVNLFVYATDRGVLENRLVPRVETREQKKAGDEMVLGRARYEGNWLIEPGVAKAWGTRVFNRAGLDLIPTDDGIIRPGEKPAQPEAKVQDDVKKDGKKDNKKGDKKSDKKDDKKKDDEKTEPPPVLDLAEIGKSDVKLIHLTGVEALTLSDAQAAAIKQYAQRGGTILVEQVGGKGGFAESIKKQLRDVLQAGDNVALPPDHPLISGAGLTGGYDVSQVDYRRYSVLNVTFKTRRPRLAAFYVNNRPAVLISEEDLSLGALDVRYWGINGYSPESALQLLTNIALYANGGSLAATE